MKSILYQFIEVKLNLACNIGPSMDPNRLLFIQIQILSSKLAPSKSGK